MTIYIPQNNLKNEEINSILNEAINANQSSNLLRYLETNSLRKTNLFNLGISDSYFHHIITSLFKKSSFNPYDSDKNYWKYKQNYFYTRFIASIITYVQEPDLNSFATKYKISIPLFVETVIPVFLLPEKAMNNVDIQNRKICFFNTAYCPEYKNLNEVLFRDFFELHETMDDNDAYQRVINRLIAEEKVNPLYGMLNIEHEELKKMLEESNISQTYFDTQKIKDHWTKEDSVAFIKIAKQNLQTVKYLADLIVTLIRLSTKNSVMLKLNDTFPNIHQRNDQDNDYYQVITSTTGIHPYAAIHNMAVTPYDYSNFKFSVDKTLENQEKVKVRDVENSFKIKPANKIDELNGLPLYSFLSKEELSSLTLSIVDKNIDFQKHISTDISYPKIEQTEDSLGVGPFEDFSFVGDDFKIYIPNKINKEFHYDSNLFSSSEATSTICKHKFLPKIYESVETVNLKTLFETSLRFTNNKITALVINNFCSGSTDNYSYEFKQVTKNQLQTGNNIFVAIAFKTTIINSETFKEEEAYYVTLVNFQPFSNFRRFTRSQKNIQYLDTLINSNCFLHPQNYHQLLSQKYGDVVKYYMGHKELFTKAGINAAMIKRLVERGNVQSKFINNERLSILNGTLDVDKKVTEQLDKLKITEKSIADKLQVERESYLHLEEKEKFLSTRIESYKDQIKNLETEIKELTNSYAYLPNELLKQKERFNKQLDLYESFQQELNRVKEIYRLKEVEAIQNKSFTADPFYANLNSRGIFIIRVDLKDENFNEFSLNNSTINSINNSSFLKMKISVLEFVIAKPIEIKVDGDPNNIIYAGPFKVLVTNDALSVAPLNASTIIAKLPNSYAIHPHASQMNLSRSISISDYFSLRRGCMGESASYIYNAFKLKTNEALKNILVNTFIWLSSANSSDAWGRNYKYFPKKGDSNLINLDQISVNLNDFTDNSIEEPSEELIEQALEQDAEYEYEEPEYEEPEDEYYEEEVEAVLPEDIQTQTYTPYVQLTNTNQNQG